MVQARWLVWVNWGSKACGMRTEWKFDRWVTGRQISDDAKLSDDEPFCDVLAECGESLRGDRG